jgi:hypothetical protein
MALKTQLKNRHLVRVCISRAVRSPKDDNYFFFFWER